MRRHGRLVGILATVLLAGCAPAGPEDAPVPELSGAQAAPGQGGGITLGAPLPHGGCQAVAYWWCHPRIYIADFGNDRIVRMDDMDGGGWTTYPRERISGLIQKRFDNPEGIYITRPTNLTGPPNSRIFVADGRGNRIVRMDDMTGAGWTELGTEGAGVMQFNLPASVYLDKQGRIYVADLRNRRIVRVDDITGAGWTVLYGDVSDPAQKFARPVAAVVDSAGRVYVIDSLADRIIRIDDMSGAGWVTYGTEGSGVGQFSRPTNIALAGGKIYVSDSENKRIVRIDDEMSGEGWTTLDTSEFGEPSGLFVHSGRIYVTFPNDCRVVRFDGMSGAGAKSFGTCGFGDGEFFRPDNVSVQ